MKAVRKRLVVVGLALMVLLLATSAVTRATVEPPRVTVLIGPIARLDGASRWSSYDRARTMAGRRYAEGFPENAKDMVESNFYDLAYALYGIHYRTGDPYWRDKARIVAKAWQADPLNQNIASYLRGNYAVHVPPPRSMSTLGLAVYALEAGDEEARRIVSHQARLAENYWPVFDGRSGDAREAGYSLMAMLAATALGDDHRTSARRSLESFLAGQKASGNWENRSDLVPAGPFTLNYMDGLAMEALILYDEVIGDPRILPSIERCLQWTWGTQWVDAARAFQYADITSGSVNTNPYANLNGLLLPAWGYAYAKTGNPAYRAQGQRILDGLIDAGVQQMWGVKQFAQMFRSSGRYLGYVESRPGPRS